MPCFSADAPRLYVAYEGLIVSYPGWRLEDARALTPRERRFFLASANWRIERSRSG